MNIGLFFGSFNPIHNGHIGLAEKIIKKKQVELIWLVLSPQSPDKKSLLSKEARSELIEIALKNKNQIVLSKIEFDLPIPNYTYKTLQLIIKKFPSPIFRKSRRGMHLLYVNRLNCQIGRHLLIKCLSLPVHLP